MLPRHPTVGKQSCPRLASDFSGGENGRVPKKDNVAAWLLLRKVNRTVIPTELLLGMKSE
jgi:hypothetical protein